MGGQNKGGCCSPAHVPQPTIPELLPRFSTATAGTTAHQSLRQVTHLEGDDAAGVSPRLLLQPRHPFLLADVSHQLGGHERVAGAQQRKRLPAWRGVAAGGNGCCGGCGAQLCSVQWDVCV